MSLGIKELGVSRDSGSPQPVVKTYAPPPFQDSPRRAFLVLAGAVGLEDLDRAEAERRHAGTSALGAFGSLVVDHCCGAGDVDLRHIEVDVCPAEVEQFPRRAPV
ncbi:hypothetical protein AB0C33_18820 [Nonomuraea sp. NPDC048881]|uniref:hypothetical protein n=1 Tax=Nonomuraea sp. NPDC048881 TaxID=3155030 RepID=UPI0033F88109